MGREAALHGAHIGRVSRFVFCYRAGGSDAGTPAQNKQRRQMSRLLRQGRSAMTVSRRNFARISAASAAVAVASPAIAQQQPTVKWRLASSFPNSIEGLWRSDERRVGKEG